MDPYGLFILSAALVAASVLTWIGKLRANRRVRWLQLRLADQQDVTVNIGRAWLDSSGPKYDVVVHTEHGLSSRPFTDKDDALSAYHQAVQAALIRTDRGVTHIELNAKEWRGWHVWRRPAAVEEVT